MARNDPSNLTWGLAPEFRSLWETCKSTPDVFRFLDARPAQDRPNGLTSSGSIKNTAGGGESLLRSSLSEPPSRYRHASRIWCEDSWKPTNRAAGESGGLAQQPLESPNGGHHSETPTQVMKTQKGDQETVFEEKLSARPGSPGGKERRKPRGLGTTCVAARAATSEECLDFNLDSPIESFAEFASLRPILNLARFTLIRRLGAGGMGVVFEAYDEERGELVALEDHAQGRPRRWSASSRSSALGDITHPNLVNLHRLFAVDGCWFFTMELVEGCDFLSHVRGNYPRIEDLETRCLAPAPAGQETIGRFLVSGRPTGIAIPLALMKAGCVTPWPSLLSACKPCIVKASCIGTSSRPT